MERDKESTNSKTRRTFFPEETRIFWEGGILWLGGPAKASWKRKKTDIDFEGWIRYLQRKIRENECVQQAAWLEHERAMLSHGRRASNLEAYLKVWTCCNDGPNWGSVAAAAAKSIQSCPTLCNPIDGSPSGSPVPGILQARTLEWVAISFSSAWKWKVKSESEVAQSCPTLRDLMDCSPPGSSVHGIFQARVLEWDAIAFSEGSISRAQKWRTNRRDIAKIRPWDWQMTLIMG